MADGALGGPGAELDLGDELGPDEDGAARLVGGELLREGALLLRERLQPPEQVRRHLLGEAGADPAGMDQLALLVIAEHERADRLCETVEGT